MQQAILIADLGFGDAGKGTITDFLAERLAAHTIVRYNGGPQAAHNVVTADGRHHTFAQFGSGTFHPRVKTLLSRYMLINPLNMLNEERHLRACGLSDALQRTQIDRRALVITPFQRALNRLREVARAAERHGSCGEGIGECMSDHLTYGDAVLFAGDLPDRATLIKKLHFLREAKSAELAELWPQLPATPLVQQECMLFTDNDAIEACADVYQHFSTCVELVDEAAIQAIFAQPGTLLFEGAQGVLLDENYGFTPYTTWSTTTFANAETLLQEHHYSSSISKIGVLRTYATRHGAGPFPSTDQALTQALPDQHNTWNDWQQTFRVGYCDLVATRYAKNVLGPLDYLALTHVDRLQTIPAGKVCATYQYHGEAQDLHRYFACEGTRIHDIKVPQQPDLAQQEQLTHRLLACTPEYQTLFAPSQQPITQAESSDYCSYLAKQLATPIGIISCGPTTTDKHCTPDFTQCLSSSPSLP